MLVVDEVYCIFEWGYNFRFDYLKLLCYCDEFNILLVLLFIVIVIKKVKCDMCECFVIVLECVV